MTDFFRIQVAFRNQAHVLQLDYQDFLAAKATYEALTTADVEVGKAVSVRDDAGTRISIDRADLLFVMFSDRTKAEEMQRTEQVRAQVAQIRAQVALQTSEEIKGAITAASLAGVQFGGPPTAMPPGRMNGPGRA